MRNRNTALANTQTGTASVRASVLCKIELAAGKAPDRLMLFPATDADGEIKCNDGRRFRLPNPQAFVAAFNAKGQEIAFDFDHGTELGGCAAIGWIKTLETMGGAIFANVQWLPTGRAAIESEEYKFVSPAFNVDWDVGEIKFPTSAALTNRPAMNMPALTHAFTGENMNPKILKLLGLDATATPEQIEAAITAYNAAQAAKEGEVQTKIVALETAATRLKSELASAQSAQPSLANFVPRSDHDAVRSELASVKQQMADEKKAAFLKDVKLVVEKASSDGKITAASVDYHMASCATAEGFELFKKYIETAGVIAPAGTPPPKPVSDSATASAEDLAIAAKCGVSKEAFLAVAKS